MLLRSPAAATGRPWRAGHHCRRPPQLLLAAAAASDDAARRRRPRPPSTAATGPTAAASPSAALDADGFVIVSPSSSSDSNDRRRDWKDDPITLAFARRRPGMVDAQGRLVLKNLTFPEVEEWCGMVESEAAAEEAGQKRAAAAAAEAGAAGGGAGGKEGGAASSAEETEADALLLLRERSRRRAVQVWRWLYSYEGSYEATDDLDATVGRQGGLSAAFAARVRGRATADGGLRLERAATAPDGTTKLVFAVVAPAASSSSSSSSSMARVVAAASNTTTAATAAAPASSPAGGGGGGGAIETVIIPVERTRRGRARATLCLSCQVGCAQDCQFCHTGRMGLLASLSAAQIVQQAVAARRWLREQAERGALPESLIGAAVTNCVMMGQGEAGQVWRPSMRPSIEVLTHPLGVALSGNKVTVSTVGLIPFMREFARAAEEGDGGGGGGGPRRGGPRGAQLALSLHATTDEVRDWIVPSNRGQGGLKAIRAALLDLYPLLPGSSSSNGGAKDDDDDDDDDDDEDNGGNGDGGSSGGRHTAKQQQQNTRHPTERGRLPSPTSSRRRRRRLLIEYVMLKGVNDTDADAARLVALLAGVDAKINLIAFNPHEGTRFRGSDPDRIFSFRAVLSEAGRVCTVRDSRGGDEAAACGQLGDIALAAAVKGGAVALPALLEPPEAFRAAMDVPPFTFKK